MNKKILIIAYHFPPDSSVGALRPQKFAKYLPEFGWQAYVLTIKEKHIENSDTERLKDVCNVEIFRTNFFRSPLQFIIETRNRVINRIKRDSLKGVENEADNNKSATKTTLARKIKKIIIDLGYFPDKEIFWVIPAIVKGFFIINKYKIKFIYATSPPPSVDLIGYLLSIMTRSKLIVDHRDPWAKCKMREENQLLVKLHHYLESMVFKKASCILTTTDKYTDELKNMMPEYLEKIYTIYNGYDSSDYLKLNNCMRHDKLIMTYLGNFYMDRSPVQFIKAVGEIVKENKEIRGKLEVLFIGTQKYINGISLEDLVSDAGIMEYVHFIDRVSYQESLKYMLNSDVLLLFAPHQYYQIPAKTFEYMASRRPILAFTEDGATADLVRNYHAGLVVPQDDLDAIKEAILILYHNCMDGNKYYEGVDVAVFERKKQTERLAAILEGI